MNFGYTFSNGETSAEAARNDTPQTLTNNGNPVPNVTLKQPQFSVPDEVNYTVGFNVAATPKVTLGFDLRGRTIRGVPRSRGNFVEYINRGPGALPQPAFTVQGEFALEPTKGNDNQVLGVVGGKINLRGTFLLNPDESRHDQRRVETSKRPSSVLTTCSNEAARHTDEED